MFSSNRGKDEDANSREATRKERNKKSMEIMMKVGEDNKIINKIHVEEAEIKKTKREQALLVIKLAEEEKELKKLTEEEKSVQQVIIKEKRELSSIGF